MWEKRGFLDIRFLAKKTVFSIKICTKRGLGDGKNY
jgi:hypothetical protein